MIKCPDYCCKYNTLEGKTPRYVIKEQKYLPVGKCKKTSIQLRYNSEGGLYCDNRKGIWA